MTGAVEAVIVEADGGSRGNPGPAAYGALVREAATGQVLAEVGETMGVATNNVAEYRGLIAGLELAASVAPGASVEVRMDSKLVVEQMSGNWKVKHANMRPLFEQASRLAPDGTVYTWVPRLENSAADQLVNDALDGRARFHTSTSESATDPALQRQGGDGSFLEVAPAETDERPPARGWSPSGPPPTTLVLVRHGVTDHTARKLFSGGVRGTNPPLNAEGRAQVRATGEWLLPIADTFDAVISSPVRRTHESAEILAGLFERPVEFDDGIAEMEFGAWDGLSFAEVSEKYPEEMQAWFGNHDHAPGGGESLSAVQQRVLEGKQRLLAAYAGKTIVAVSHVTPIKCLVVDAMEAPLHAVYRMELAPASVTVISYFKAGPEHDIPMVNMRLFNARPTDSFSL